MLGLSFIFPKTESAYLEGCKELEWKVVRYEELIKQQIEILGTLLLKTDGLIEYVVKHISNENVKNTLFPIIQHLFSQTFSQENSRFNEIYLDQKRQSYKKFISLLRKALDYFEKNRHELIARNVLTLGYKFYSQIRFNNCGAEIFNNLMEFGKKATLEQPNISTIVPNDSRYKLIFGLEIIRQRMLELEKNSVLTSTSFGRYQGQYQSSGKLFFGLFDPHIQGNFVSLKRKFCVYQPANKFCVKNLMMPSPTIETGGPISINSEMRAFLTLCREKQKTILYINCQDRCPSVGLIAGDDSYRCQAIESLAEEFANTLFLITLTHDHPFYEQIGHQIDTLNSQLVKKAIFDQIFNPNFRQFEDYILPTEEIKKWMVITFDVIHAKKFSNCGHFSDAQERDFFIEECHLALIQNEEMLRLGYSIYHDTEHFKKELLRQIFIEDKQKSGNSVPEKIVLIKESQKYRFNLKHWCLILTDQIHDVLFNKQKVLSPKEKRIFIRLFYNYLTMQLLVFIEPKFLNMSSTNSTDRSISFEEMFAHELIVKGLEDNPEMIAHFEMSIHLRAMMICKRAVGEKQLNRLLETILFMLDHKDQIKTLFAKVFPNVNFENDILEKTKKSSLPSLFQKEQFKNFQMEHILPELMKTKEFQKYLKETIFSVFLGSEKFREIFQSEIFKYYLGKTVHLPDLNDEHAINEFLQTQAQSIDSALASPDCQTLLIQAFLKESASLKEYLETFILRQIKNIKY
jgi:hypothetical protein